jgi:hypothetical protein
VSSAVTVTFEPQRKKAAEQSAGGFGGSEVPGRGAAHAWRADPLLLFNSFRL